MRKHAKLLVIFTALMVIVAGCSKAVDEKLDEDYGVSRTEVQAMVGNVELLAEKMDIVVTEHAHQDERITRYGPPRGEDLRMQERHVAWFIEFEPKFSQIKKWIDDANATLALHDSLEETHDNAPSKQIKADHKKMAEELEILKPKAQEYKEALENAMDTTSTFFKDHAYLNNKYKVPSEHGLKPPTSK
ncbi:hypothetical protein JXM67_13730 [candidate division WOR-3 bacterium]|nr:hypothetical protein [candidate division WOR-3 bacterium]